MRSEPSDARLTLDPGASDSRGRTVGSAARGPMVLLDGRLRSRSVAERVPRTTGFIARPADPIGRATGDSLLESPDIAGAAGVSSECAKVFGNGRGVRMEGASTAFG